MEQAIFSEKFNNKKSEVVFHVIFWIAFFIYLVGDAYLEAALPVVLLDSLIYFAITIALVYSNISLLVPHLLYKRKYFTYIILLLFWISAGAACKQYTYTYVIPSPDAFNAPEIYIFFSWFFRTLFEVAAISSVKIAQDRVNTKDRLQQVEKQRLETELKFLKAQVNPHFLFNTLNNIFFLIKKEPEKASGSILKLSEMLRFRLYDETEGHKISIQKEIDYIRNYIELEQLRSKDRLSVDLVIEGETIEHTIEPFIFLDFVENAFKHNGATVENKGSIKIKCSITHNQLSFTVENSINQMHEKTVTNSKGIGLPNVRKRLELIYPEKHLLAIQENHHTFTVNLLINV